MINEVRNDVLSILNKNNYGFISPSDFNNYANLAQLDIFEQYFFKYNQWIIKQNVRQANTGLADMTKRMEDVIEEFSVTASPTVSTPTNSFTLPTNIFFLNRVTYVKETGRFIDIEKCSRLKINQLLMSNLTQPIDIFPMYYNEGKKIFVYPDTIVDQNKIKIDYVRYPAQPKWTWRNISGGAPMFDQSQPDYQDFELPKSDHSLLVAKILQYAGFEIREDAAVQSGLQEEQKTMQMES
jgi:hypothetical protein